MDRGDGRVRVCRARPDDLRAARKNDISVSQCAVCSELANRLTLLSAVGKRQELEDEQTELVLLVRVCAIRQVVLQQAVDLVCEALNRAAVREYRVPCRLNRPVMFAPFRECGWRFL